MAYQALYRKYRLASFEDMVGQEHISKTIKNAIASNKISHAYLFTGPRGTGKTSIAKLIARAVNCTGSKVLCGECDVCKEIIANQSSDIIEIDAASNNGVDEIRDIRDKVKYAPSSCKYKVYIIDETHMLTTQAFNALLKTLEEPPSHVIFILATTEPHKIPLTILSRCQRFDFRRISEEALISRLNQVISAENIMITEDAIRLIAYLSDGGMRDALSLLDQVSSYIDREITVQDIYSVTGTASKDAVEKLVRAILEKDRRKILQEINGLNNQGKDLVKLCESIIVYLRDALVSSNGIKDDLIYHNSPVFAVVSKLQVSNIYDYISFLSDVLYKLKGVHNPKIFLEVSLINLSEHVKVKVDFEGAKTADEEKFPNKEFNIFESNAASEVVEEPAKAVEEEIIEEIVEEVIEDISVVEPEVNPTSEVTKAEEAQPVVENDPNDDFIDFESESVIIDDEYNNDLEEESKTVEITPEMEKKYLNYLRGVRINNTLESASKMVLNSFKEYWSRLKHMDGDMANTHIISILCDARLRAATINHVIVSVQTEMMVIKLMSDIKNVETILSELFGEVVSVAIVSETEWDRIKEDYKAKIIVGEKYKIIPEQSFNEYYNIKDQGDKIVEMATDYFGTNNVKVEE